MKTPATPSLATIAAEVGVSRMSVSRALRNVPSVDEALRRRVHAVARRLGYRRDPRLTELMEYLRHRRERPARETLAFVLCQRSAEEPRLSAAVRRFLEGITLRARSHGYALERFALAPGLMSPHRLAQILRTRGIEGVIICNVWAAGADFDGLLQDTVACLGGTARPELRTHRAASNHYHNIRLALRALQERGYRRIGLYLDEETDRNLQHCWRAGLADHLFAEGIGLADLLQVVPGWQSEDFRSWVRRARPEAVLTLHPPAAEWVRGMAGRRRIGLALLDLEPGMREVAGLDQNGEEIGKAAVDLVAARLLAHDLGLPDHPHLVTVEGTWVDGPSLPMRAG